MMMIITVQIKWVWVSCSRRVVLISCLRNRWLADPEASTPMILKQTKSIRVTTMILKQTRVLSAILIDLVACPEQTLKTLGKLAGFGRLGVRYPLRGAVWDGCDKDGTRFSVPSRKVLYRPTKSSETYVNHIRFRATNRFIFFGKK
jgi:hypothetical protein